VDLTVHISTFHSVNRSLAAGLARTGSARPIDRVNDKKENATSLPEIADSDSAGGDDVIDTFELSPAAQKRLSELETRETRTVEGETRQKSDESTNRVAAADDAADRRAETDTNETQASTAEVESDSELSEEEQKVVNELKERDREVRAHEAAHLAAAGRYSPCDGRYCLRLLLRL
jgi:hypothetical protein